MDNEDLIRRFEELLKKYQTALDNDIEFEDLKKIYLELKDIKLKLSNITNK